MFRFLLRTLASNGDVQPWLAEPNSFFLNGNPRHETCATFGGVVASIENMG